MILLFVIFAEFLDLIHFCYYIYQKYIAVNFQNEKKNLSGGNLNV